jgi:hypothetical protein
MMNVISIRKKAERARVACGLSEKDLSRLQAIAWSTYEEVSYDLAPDFKTRGTCRRSTIIEVVTDASRLESRVRYVEKLSHSHTEDANHPLVKACRNSELIADLIGPAFLANEYEAGEESC